MVDQTHLAHHIIELYRRHGRAWTMLRGQYLYEKNWLDRFLIFLPKYAAVLDLGCGSGKPITDYLIQHRHCITGVDSSDVMIEMAKQNFPKHTWLQADMRTVQLDQKFQGILAWDSFFHLTPHDQRQMFSHFEQYAEQGTALMFTSGSSEGEAIGELFGDALYHASLSQEEYRTLLKQHGFEVMNMIVDDPNCAGHTVWLARKA